jgi:hypothetical protein
MPNIAKEENAYIKQNDFEILKLQITSTKGGDPINLLPQFVEVVIYETIFDTKMIGELTIVDTLNYSETIPLVGNEIIEISYRTKGAKDTVDIVARIFAIFGKSRTTNEKSETCKMKFISVVQYDNNKRKISCSKKGSIGKIAKEIFDENFKGSIGISIDETNNKSFQFIFPYWTPINSINWLAKRAFTPGPSNGRGPSCFVFYEDVDGFHFADIVGRSILPPVMTYRYEPNNSVNTSNVNRYLEKVQDYNVSSYFDRLMEYKTGMYSGYLMTHDITTKKMSYYEYDYHNSFDRTYHLNEHKLISSADRELTNAKLGFLNYMPVQTKRTDSIIDNDAPQDYFPVRASVLRQFNTIKLSLLVNGNSTLRLLDVIDFEIPKIGFLDTNEKDWEDMFLSGKYIITSMKHKINREDGYNTTLELAKDSLIKGIPDVFEI